MVSLFQTTWIMFRFSLSFLFHCRQTTIENKFLELSDYSSADNSKINVQVTNHLWQKVILAVLILVFSEIRFRSGQNLL